MQLHLKRTEAMEGLVKKSKVFKMSVKLEADEKEREAIKDLGFEEYSLYEPYEGEKGIQHDLQVRHAYTGVVQTLPNALMVGTLLAQTKERAQIVADHVRNYMDTGSESEEVIDL